MADLAAQGNRAVVLDVPNPCANPQIVSQLTGTVDSSVSTVGGVANTALQPGAPLSGVAGTLGQTLNNVTQPGSLPSRG